MAFKDQMSKKRKVSQSYWCKNKTAEKSIKMEESLTWLCHVMKPQQGKHKEKEKQKRKDDEWDEKENEYLLDMKGKQDGRGTQVYECNTNLDMFSLI